MHAHPNSVFLRVVGMFVLGKESERRIVRNEFERGRKKKKVEALSKSGKSGLLDFISLCFKKPGVLNKIICFRALLARNSAMSSKSKDSCLNCGAAAGYSF